MWIILGRDGVWSHVSRFLKRRSSQHRESSVTASTNIALYDCAAFPEIQTFAARVEFLWL